MDPNRQQWRAPAATARTEQVLERYYAQLIEWGTLLTRGDQNKALDLVHDFFLYFTVTKPDIVGIANLDGYLYQSLRHIYLSNLNRSSREALRFVSTAEFDSIQFALSPHHASESLQRQNDLRRICCYAAWRKAQTKSASYFILRFFHGYHHQEIADLACVPIAAIYTKFRAFRVEARSYLEEPGKLQFASRDFLPNPALSWIPVSSFDLFKELRKIILNARSGPCLPENELLKPYSFEHPAPISCSLLAHIVSCERCLALIDRHLRRPTLKDREPLDAMADISGGAEAGASRPGAVLRDRLLRSARKYGSEVLQHRPITLSIAVDGKIIASHDVQARRSAQSARVEQPVNASFIEVFSEQGIRLALLPIGELPPQGPHRQTLHVALSDDRWLDLSLSFDGQGLNIEVVCFDPALVSETVDQDESEAVAIAPSRSESKPKASVIPWPRLAGWMAFACSALRPLALSPVLGWSVAIAFVFCAAGYFALHSGETATAPSAGEILNRSIQAEAASLAGQTEHQVFRFEEEAVGSNVVQQGTIDLWKDGDGKRSLRRLYDAEHQLIAAEWLQSDGRRGEYLKGESAQSTGPARALLDGDLWRQEVSPSAFRQFNSESAHVRPTGDGYEVTVAEPAASRSLVLFATLVLDRHFHPVREFLRVHNGGNVFEARFVQADYELRSSSSVPDAVFNLPEQGPHLRIQRHSVSSNTFLSDAQLTELHIAALYQLSSLGADTREPIEVRETPDGHVRVAGPVADDTRKREILAWLSQLQDHGLLETQIVSPSDAGEQISDAPRVLSEFVSTYDVEQTKPPADVILRSYFRAHGLSDKALSAAVGDFSRDALKHAQRALQEASVLKRLSDAFPVAKLRSISRTSQQQWSEIVAKHAVALEGELRSLHEQLAPLSPSREPFPGAASDAAIESPEQFSGVTGDLFAATKNLDQSIGCIFASSQAAGPQPADLQALITAALNMIPLQRAANLSSFALELNASAGMAQINEHQINEHQINEQKMNQQESRSDR